MKHILIILAALLCGYAFGYPCSGCCNGNKSLCCSRSGSSCCGGSRSNCCSGSESSCCGGCIEGASSCCCESSSSCCDGRKPPCCPRENCNTSTTPSPISTTPTNPTPTNPTTPCPHPPSQPGTSCNTSVINNNNITIPTNISIQNDLHTETRVSVPVSVVVNNENNVRITSESNQVSEPKCCDKNCTNHESCTNTTKVVTDTIKVPVEVPVPYPVPIPQPYVVTVPIERPAPTGCCTMVAPCTPYTYNGCVHNSLQCGGQCSGSVMYQPTNLCQSGCFQVPSSYGVQCGTSGCNRTPVDCSMCNGNWGQSYAGFKMCSGCFFPLSWGGGLGSGLRGVFGGGFRDGFGGGLGSGYYRK